MIRIGIVDSGIDGPARARVVAAADFPAPGAPLPPGEPRDRCGHGSAVAEVITLSSPAIELLDARVFFDSLHTSATQVAAAIDWLIEQDARLVNLSIGLHADRPVLREACARAAARGVLLIGSAPARGAAVFPAGYPGVVRATGDARCTIGEISHIATAQADFGAHVRTGELAGASAGCAHVSAALASWLSAHPADGNEAALAALRERAAYHGPERHPPRGDGG